jgi:hypothetical protein
MVNKGKRIGDSKKKKEVKSITFFHNPNDTQGLPDPVQQFDILDGVEKEKKVRPKDVFEDYNDPKSKAKQKKTKPQRDEKKKHRNVKMTEMQQKGKIRGLDKKKVPAIGTRVK